MSGHVVRRSRRIIITLAAGALAAGAMPASASADAAELAIGNPVLQGVATSYIQGTNTMGVVVECSALSVSPVASTKVSCSAGPARGQVELPGQFAAIAGTGTGPLSNFTLCVSGSGRTLSGATFGRTLCSVSYQGTAAVAG